MSNKENDCLPIVPYRDGLVLRGYDVVEYHNLKEYEKGVKGNEKFSYILENNLAKNIFYFKSQENLNKFKSNINKYLPQFGGFCSWGFANEWGSIIDGTTIGDPDVPKDCEECINDPPWPWTKDIMGPPADTEYGWYIYQGKLYFNINKYYTRLWLKNTDKNIKLAEERWEKYFGKNNIGPLNVRSYPWNWKMSTYLTDKEKECLKKNLEKIKEEDELNVILINLDKQKTERKAQDNNIKIQLSNEINERNIQTLNDKNLIENEIKKREEDDDNFNSKLELEIIKRKTEDLEIILKLSKLENLIK